MSKPSRGRLIESVAADVRAFQTAVDAFETRAAAALRLDRTALRCLVALADAHDISRVDLAATSRIDQGNLETVIRKLIDAGHLGPDSGTPSGLHVTPATREVLQDLYGPLEAGRPGLHRFSAEELAIVRRFLRAGREIYEAQLERAVFRPGS